MTSEWNILKFREKTSIYMKRISPNKKSVKVGNKVRLFLWKPKLVHEIENYRYVYFKQDGLTYNFWYNYKVSNIDTEKWIGKYQFVFKDNLLERSKRNENFYVYDPKPIIDQNNTINFIVDNEYVSGINLRIDGGL